MWQTHTGIDIEQPYGITLFKYTNQHPITKLLVWDSITIFSVPKCTFFVFIPFLYMWYWIADSFRYLILPQSGKKKTRVSWTDNTPGNIHFCFVIRHSRGVVPSIVYVVSFLSVQWQQEQCYQSILWPRFQKEHWKHIVTANRTLCHLHTQISPTYTLPSVEKTPWNS